VNNHKHEGLRIYKQQENTQKETQDHLDQEGGARDLIPPLDKKNDQLLRPCLEKENMITQVPSQKKLNIKDKTPHNLFVVG
jgi:hypothetical protein